MALLLLLPTKKNRYFRRKKRHLKNARVNGIRCTGEREWLRERESAVANTNAALQVQLSLTYNIYKAAYLLHNGKTTIERANIHTHTLAYICIRIGEIENQPSQAYVRPTVWPKAEQTNQNRSVPKSNAGADDDADVAVTVAVVASRRCIAAIKESAVAVAARAELYLRTAELYEWTTHRTHTHTRRRQLRRLQKKRRKLRR